MPFVVIGDKTQASQKYNRLMRKETLNSEEVNTSEV